MNLVLQRILHTPHSTTGQLSIDGSPFCVTLEPPTTPDPQGNGFVCVVAGTFKLTIRWSDEFQKPTPHVENVPGRTVIELHVGNWPRDSKGCGLVGKDFDDQPDYVSQSAVTFTALMNRLYAGSTLTNPDAPEIQQVWDVGTITYLEPQGAL